MKCFILKSWRVGKNNDLFILHVGYKQYDLGIQIHGWGVRLMLIWWHICIHFKN